MDTSLVSETQAVATAPVALLEIAPVPGKRRNRPAKQKALLAAATKLFALRGYDATTTREIAARAGCAEGLIHRYFNGKAGLLLALIQQRISQEVVDLRVRIPLAPTLEAEFLQLVEWEVECLWEDRDFLKVIIPRALLDPSMGKILARIGASRHAQVIVKRLRHFIPSRSLLDGKLEALARMIGVLGFTFGFMRPVVLGQDRGQAEKMARQIASTFIQGL